MSKFCVCKKPFVYHEHTCIFSGYIPDNQMTEEQKKAKWKVDRAGIVPVC